MKKVIIAAVLIAVLASFLGANELGVGYNNGGPSVRFKWDDAITSEFSMRINYTNNAEDAAAVNEITLAIAPVNLALYRGELGQVSLGFVFGDKIVYSAGKGVGSGAVFTANDYFFNLLLPEVELNFPGVKELKLIGSLGIGSSWGYAENGELDAFNMNLFGIGLANVGIIYYFDLGKTAPAAAPAVKPVETPAAKSLPVPSPVPTAAASKEVAPK